MKTLFKTPEQVEFATLFEELEGAGFTQADVARSLHLSRAAVSTYLKGGGSSPSERTLAGMRGLVRSLPPGAGEREGAKPEPPKEATLEEQLSFLKKHDPPGYEAAKRTVEALHRQAREKASSSAPYGLESTLKRAVERAQKPGVVFGKKRRAGSPSGKTASPSEGEPASPGDQPGSPTQALK